MSSIQLSVTLSDGTLVADGLEVSRSQGAHAPTASLSGASPHTSYSLVMVDPDAPRPESPTMAEWLHWIVANIPGGDVSKGDTITSYAGPTPPHGTHRYIFNVYEQPEGVRVPKTHIEQRARFSASDWAKRNGMSGIPVATVHFVTKAGHEFQG